MKLTVLVAVSFIVSLTASAAQDSITVGSVTASGTSADVPVYIRDLAGTTLGIDQPVGSKIQSFSIKVNYAPASAVQSVTFSRAGITAGLTAIEFPASGPGTVSLIATFQEATNPIPFALNAAAPGNLVAHLVFTLAPSAAPGSSVTLSLDASSLTQLSNQGGTQQETVANGALALVDGAISIPALSVSLQPLLLEVPLGTARLLTARASSNVSVNTSVTLSSSKPTVAEVPATVVIPAGQKSAGFNVAGLAVGSATITATLGDSTATAEVDVTNCPELVAPVATAPEAANVGTPYTVSWAPVAHATDYQIDESTSATFQGATTTIVITTSASFTHDTPGIRYYYRVRARNQEGTCNIVTAYSTAVSVLVSAVPLPVTRVLPVAGSLPGGFGSYFKTSLALYNPRDVAATGKLVFHPAGAQGSSNDPSLSYTLAPLQTVFHADLLPAMGVATGLGSIDLVADPSTPSLVALARVFNDAGELGTTGFTEEALALGDALGAGTAGVLIAPSDVRKFRLNLGVRTLEAGATMTITVRDTAGATVKSVTTSFGPTSFTQVASSVMLDGYALAGGESITFQVTSGSAFVYGATTDNTTNDPSVQLARPIE
ncbi:MAG: fibronectin type III domain-containing protein [Thermoanaerobaculia bacterium]|jgi:hypothetical protein